MRRMSGWLVSRKYGRVKARNGDGLRLIVGLHERSTDQRSDLEDGKQAVGH